MAPEESNMVVQIDKMQNGPEGAEVYDGRFTK